MVGSGGDSAWVTVTGGLTLNGTATLRGAAADGGTLAFTGSQTLGGTATIVFGSPANTLAVSAGATLTIGPGITVRGQNGRVGTAGGSVINQGTITADVAPGTVTLDGASWLNQGTLQAQNGATLAAAVPLNSAGSVQALSGGTLTAAGMTIDGSGALSSRPPGSVNVTRNLVGATVNADQFTALGTLRLNGNGTATAPQLLEVMSQDVGAVTAGFAGKFVYGQLALANNTYVRLVDNARNSPGTIPEALYVSSLAVPAGTTLNLNGLRVYARALQTGGTITGGTVNVLPPGGPVTLESPAPGVINSDAQVDEWTFFGRTGQAMAVVVNTGAGGAPQPLLPHLNFANVQVMAPGGAVLASGTNTQSGADVSLPGVSLPADGTYRVRVRAGQAGRRGNYVLTVWETTVREAPLELNRLVSSRIDAPYRVERWTFAAAANDHVQLEVGSASNPSVRFDLTGPGGYTGFTGLAGSSTALTLPTAGTYVLRAYGVGVQTGAYAFRLLKINHTDLALGTPYTGTLVGSGQTQLFRVTVPDTGPLRVALQDGASTHRNQLYAKFGGAPTRADFQYRSSGMGSASQEILIPSAAPGPWFVLLYSEAVPAPGPFQLQATVSNVMLTRVTPDRAGNGAAMTLTLTGAGFDPATSVELVEGFISSTGNWQFWAST